MHVAIDLDDVVLDFFPHVLACFEREFGQTPDYDGHPWGDAAVAFTKHPALLAAGYKSWWDWLRDREWLWAIAPAVPGAIGGIETLRNMGHYVECVTSKPEWAEHNVWKWLGKWRPKFHRVTIIDSKAGQRKVDMTDAELIVDDKLLTCEEFRDAGRKAVLFDRSSVSYRYDPRKFPGIHVAHTWADIVQGLSPAGEAEPLGVTSPVGVPRPDTASASSAALVTAQGKGYL